MPGIMLAANVGEAGGGSGFSVIVGAIGDVVSIVGKIWDVVVSNPLLLFGVGAAVIGTAAGVFSTIRSSVK